MKAKELAAILLQNPELEVGYVDHETEQFYEVVSACPRTEYNMIWFDLIYNN